MDTFFKQVKEELKSMESKNALREKLSMIFTIPMHPEKLVYLKNHIPGCETAKDSFEAGIHIAHDVRDSLEKFRANMGGLLLKFDPADPQHRHEAYKTLIGTQKSIAAYRCVTQDLVRKENPKDAPLTDTFKDKRQNTPMHEEALGIMENWLETLKEEIQKLPNGPEELAAFKDKVEKADLSNTATRDALFEGLKVSYINPQEWAKLGSTSPSSGYTQENE